jgi:hypothetical protein
LWRVDRREWKVVGRNILTNVGPKINLVFTARIDDVSQWDALFRPAFALSLAYACKELCKDEATIEDVHQAAANAVLAAMPVDASEGTPDELPQPDVIAVRDAQGFCAPWERG